MATILDITGTRYPEQHNGKPVEPLEGASLTPLFAAEQPQRPPMFWEHEGNAAVRIGKWKLVKKFPEPWELYDMETDRTELDDLAARHPERVAEMAAQYDAWAARCGVIPREKIVDLMRRQDAPPAFWEQDVEEPGAAAEPDRSRAGPRRCRRRARRLRPRARSDGACCVPARGAGDGQRCRRCAPARTGRAGADGAAGDAGSPVRSARPPCWPSAAASSAWAPTPPKASPKTAKGRRATSASTPSALHRQR